MRQKYLDRETYDKLVNATLAIEIDTFVDKESAIKIALGEVGDIWPNDIVDYVDDVNHDKAA